MTAGTQEELHQQIRDYLKDVDFTEKKMFGGLAFFINRNMFAGTHQSDFFLRLSQEDREEFLNREGIMVFEPRSGMVMREYVALSYSVISNKSLFEELFQKSISHVSRLPPKEPKKKK